MAMIVENEKIFEHYEDLFPKLRMMVVDEMQPEDRCRFTRCSKSSNQETKASKKYIFGLEMVSFSENEVKFVISYENYERNPQNIKGYTMKFRERDRNKYVQYLAQRNIELWKEPIDSSVDLFQFAVEQFKKLLKAYQNKIKYLQFSGESFEDKLANYDFGIDSLNNLEMLSLYGHHDIANYFSKLQKPLKRIAILGPGNYENVPNIEEIYQIEYCVNLDNVRMTYEQMLRLKAAVVFLPLDGLTERDIFKFIRSWQDGSVGKYVKFYVWSISWPNPNFDLDKLFRLLRIKKTWLSRFEIKHHNEAGKSAKLEWQGGRLIFEVESIDV